MSETKIQWEDHLGATMSLRLEARVHFPAQGLVGMNVDQIVSRTYDASEEDVRRAAEILGYTLVKNEGNLCDELRRVTKTCEEMQKQVLEYQEQILRENVRRGQLFRALTSSRNTVAEAVGLAVGFDYEDEGKWDAVIKKIDELRERERLLDGQLNQVKQDVAATAGFSIDFDCRDEEKWKKVFVRIDELRRKSEWDAKWLVAHALAANHENETWEELIEKIREKSDVIRNLREDVERLASRESQVRGLIEGALGVDCDSKSWTGMADMVKALREPRSKEGCDKGCEGHLRWLQQVISNEREAMVGVLRALGEGRLAEKPDGIDWAVVVRMVEQSRKGSGWSEMATLEAKNNALCADIARLDAKLSQRTEAILDALQHHWPGRPKTDDEKWDGAVRQVAKVYGEATETLKRVARLMGWEHGLNAGETISEFWDRAFNEAEAIKADLSRHKHWVETLERIDRSRILEAAEILQCQADWLIIMKTMKAILERRESFEDSRASVMSTVLGCGPNWGAIEDAAREAKRLAKLNVAAMDDRGREWKAEAEKYKAALEELSAAMQDKEANTDNARQWKALADSTKMNLEAQLKGCQKTLYSSDKEFARRLLLVLRTSGHSPCSTHLLDQLNVGLQQMAHCLGIESRDWDFDEVRWGVTYLSQAVGGPTKAAEMIAAEQKREEEEDAKEEDDEE